jgi:hypothetical protein
VRLAQRIPVRIRLTDVPAGVLISSGMTCTVMLKDGAKPEIGASAKRLMAAIWPTSGATASVSAPALSTSSTHIANFKNRRCYSASKTMHEALEFLTISCPMLAA